MKKNKTSRYFSIVTYLSEFQLYAVLAQHTSSIRSYMFIEHDKDEAEPHIHLLLRTYSCWNAEQLAKWFSGFSDTEGKKINTFCEIASSIESLVPYILHDTDEAREAGKHLYDPSSLKKGNERELLPRKDCYDETYNILNDMLAGQSLRQMVKRYGKDFVYHYHQYQGIVDNILSQEGIIGAHHSTAKDRAHAVYSYEGIVDAPAAQDGNFEALDPDDDLPF